MAMACSSAKTARRWEERNSGLAIKDVYTVASVAEAGGITLYAGTQPAALFKSRDLGQSWSELPALRQVPGIEYWTFVMSAYATKMGCSLVPARRKSAAPEPEEAIS
jgi:hypothetical protein